MDYDIESLANALRDATRKPPRWLTVLVAPVAIVYAFISTLYRESKSAWWYAGNAVAQEIDAIKTAWRR